MLRRAKSGPLRRAVASAGDAYRASRADDAVRLVVAARDLPAAASPVGDELAALAEGHELQARVHIDRGRLQDALDSFGRAERLLDGRSEHANLLGRIFVQMAYELAGVPSLTAMRQHYEQRALELLTGSKEYGYLADALRDSAEANLQAGPDRVSAARKQLDEMLAERRPARRLPGRRRQADLRERAGQAVREFLYAALEHGNDSDVAEAFREAISWVEVLDETDDLFHVAELARHLLDRPPLGLQSELETLTRLAETTAQRTGAVDQRADALMVSALVARERGDLASSLAHVCAAVGHAQQAQVVMFASVALRAGLRHRLDDMRAYACDLALTHDQPELVAELLESARLQAIVDDAATASDFDEDRDDVLALLGSTDARLAGVAPVAVGGVSRLGDATGLAGSASAAPPDLDEWIGRVGGREGWFWSSWAWLGDLYWAVRGPDGGWHAGRTSISGLAEALSDVETDLHGGDRSGQFENHDTERAIAGTIGATVLPEPLVGALRTAQAPLDVVVAGSFISELPLAAAVLPGTSDTRLVEKATLRWLPPLALLPPVARAAEQVEPPLPVLVAVADPAGDLSNARHTDLVAGDLLTGTEFRRGAEPPPPWARPATRVNFVAALSALTAGEAGMLVFYGHVDQPGVADGPSTSLVLTDGLLPAQRLRGLPAPSHVLLSACESSGASGTGAGEWLGLAGSLLLAGARQVVATSWPLPDTAFTGRMDRELTEQIRLTGDSAASLTRVQRAALDQWREQEWSPTALEDAALPRTWAAFIAIGY